MKRGDVVEIDWQFSDLTGSELRPAVVVQADFLDALTDDTILVKITGSYFGIPGTEVRIGPAVETTSGLSKICYAACKDILTRDKALILRTVGVLSDAVMRPIDDCSKKVLELP